MQWKLNMLMSRWWTRKRIYTIMMNWWPVIVSLETILKLTWEWTWMETLILFHTSPGRVVDGLCINNLVKINALIPINNEIKYLLGYDHGQISGCKCDHQLVLWSHFFPINYYFFVLLLIDVLYKVEPLHQIWN